MRGRDVGMRRSPSGPSDYTTAERRTLRCGNRESLMREPPQHLLGGLTVAILAANGFEQAELTGPREALQALGVETRLLSLATGRIQGLRYEQAAETFDVDMALDKADPEAYDAVLLPGGRQNAERLR